MLSGHGPFGYAREVFRFLGRVPGYLDAKRSVYLVFRKRLPGSTGLHRALRRILTNRSPVFSTSVLAGHLLSNSVRNYLEKETSMDSAILKGKWNQLRGEIRTRWGKLTDDDL